jgi:glycosyltransferase involved in cell wall biosynthesis
MKLSAYLIVKNEAECLPHCLASLGGIDELVIVDTGSTDGTLALLADLEAGVWRPIPPANDARPEIKIGHFAWCDDFSAARNAALDRVTGDWAIIIDADEWIAEGTVEALRKAIASPEEGNVAPSTYWFVCTCGGNQAQWHHMVRAHRVAPEIRWKHRIHECLTVDSRAIAPGCQLYYGHSPAHGMDPDRALRILGKVIAENPDDPRARYYLGRDLYFAGRYAESAEHLEHRLRLAEPTDPNKAETDDAYLLLARCLWSLRRGDEALAAAAKAATRNPEFKEALLALAGMCSDHWHGLFLELGKKADNSGVHFVRF